MNRLIALFTVAILAFVMPVESQARGGGGGRHSWGGSSHTSSHGGTYGQVEGIEAVVGRVLVRHDLHLEAPGRVVLAGDCLPQVTPMVVEVLGAYGPRLGVGEVLDAVLGLEVVLEQELLACSILPHIRA